MTSPVFTVTTISTPCTITFITSLQKSWEVEDEGDISDLLGVQIDRGKDRVTMTQTAYIDRMMSTWCPDGHP